MATLPTPVPGLVIRYSYLWLSESREGREEGRKDRPCAIVLSTLTASDATSVVVVPITHRPPPADILSLEIPAVTKRRLGLDGDRSWIVLSEANQFIWPGPDLRPATPGVIASVAYGELPGDLFRKLRTMFVKSFRERRSGWVQRTQ